MVIPWFSHGLPMVFLWSPAGFPLANLLASLQPCLFTLRLDRRQGTLQMGLAQEWSKRVQATGEPLAFLIIYFVKMTHLCYIYIYILYVYIYIYIYIHT